MCQSRRQQKSFVAAPGVASLLKISLILVFFLFAECAAGSCLSYGHACWGAHGKRSGNSKSISDETPIKPNANTRWFLSKLVNGPFDLRYMREGDFDLTNNRQQVEDNFEENMKERPNRHEYWENIQDSIAANDHDQLYDETNPSDKNLEKYFKSPKYLDKRSVKPR